MKTVTNQFQQTYGLDQKSKKSEPDGDIYKIEGSPCMWVKLLKDHSKEKQFEVEQKIRMGGFGAGAPREVVYSRGKFAGYTFEKKEQVIKPEPDPGMSVPPFGFETGKTDNYNWDEPRRRPIDEYEPRRRLMDAYEPAGNTFGSGALKVVGLLILGALLSLLNLKVFFGTYLSFLYGRESSEVISGCVTVGFSGITSTVGGILLMLLAAKVFYSRTGMIVYWILTGAAYLLGLVAVDCLLTILVKVVGVVIALIPSILVIVGTVAGIVLMSKAIFSK